MKVKGQVRPLKDRILVCNMNFGEQRTNLGIILRSDDGKVDGIKPRWGKVWAIGPEQKDVEVGQWICIEHGRWTRKFEIEQEDGSILPVHGVDNKSILLVSDEEPNIHD